MGTPTIKLEYDRRKRASAKKEGSVELRIVYNRRSHYVSTGVRVLPKQWRRGQVVNRLDAYELQRTLDMYVAKARRIINDLTEKGELDMATVTAEISGRQKKEASKNVVKEKLLMDYFRERAEVRKYGRTEDSRERYDRFLRWFEAWGGMMTFEDITELKVVEMDKALAGMKPYSKWNNYHRFLNSFILDAINDGLLRKNPYKSIHIVRENGEDSLAKFLTREEFRRIEELKPTTTYLRHARDLFVFQTYTCLSYTDLASFDATRIKEVNGRSVYVGRRGKTNQEYTFMLLEPALQILRKYSYRLPIMTNQKYNEYIKALAGSAKIDKPVSSHWARHTGATMMLNAGVNMEVVAKILGHSSTKITRRVYAKLLDETVTDAMAAVEGQLL
jgi:integrase